jgi:hypothetical protein
VCGGRGGVGRKKERKKEKPIIFENMLFFVILLRLF